MKIQNALVSNILDLSQRYFAHVTTVTLPWRVQNIVVIGCVYFTLECFEFSSNFEFDRNMFSGTGAWLFYENRFRRLSVILQTTFHTVSVILQTDTHEICWGDAHYREAGRYLKWPCSVIFSAFDRTLTFSMVGLNQGRGKVAHIKKCGEIT